MGKFRPRTRPPAAIYWGIERRTQRTQITKPHDCNIPEQVPACPPRDEGHAIRAFAICSGKTRGFFSGGNSCSGKSSPDQIIRFSRFSSLITAALQPPATAAMSQDQMTDRGAVFRGDLDRYIYDWRCDLLSCRVNIEIKSVRVNFMCI